MAFFLKDECFRFCSGSMFLVLGLELRYGEAVVHRSVECDTWAFSSCEFYLKRWKGYQQLVGEVRTITRCISLLLELMPGYSSWTKIFLAERLGLFIQARSASCFREHGRSKYGV